ncbi:MAG: ABC transporter ATP-binding protein [Candidatus Hodarchaeales archaeon]|jgi:sodium transport system ATP-binding protein
MIPPSSSFSEIEGDFPAIETFHLTKIYHSKGERILALDNVNINIKQGEIYGLVGENGAGKTTFVRCVTSMIRPTAGQAKIMGIDVLTNPQEIRRHLGVLPQEAGLYPEFSVHENLLFFAKLQQISEPEQHVYDLINLIGMIERGHQRAESLSGGLKRRVALARALIGYPKVIFLDEPTTGLDVLVARKVRHIISRMANISKSTVILSTHNMFEAEKLCNRVGVLHKGRLIAEDTPHGLIERYRRSSEDNLEDIVASLIGYDSENISGV